MIAFCTQQRLDYPSVAKCSFIQASLQVLLSYNNELLVELFNLSEDASYCLGSLGLKATVRARIRTKSSSWADV